LTYSETRPGKRASLFSPIFPTHPHTAFIRGLLENVGSEINPIRLIRRIKNGLEIPGLKEALIKILQDFNLQISLMEGCNRILGSDCGWLGRKLEGGQSKGFLLTGE
jgi:vacuolar protein sorting-associated protein 41